MNRQRITTTIFPTSIRRALLVAALFTANPLAAQDTAPTVSFQFSQTGFADGGVVRGFVSGQDLDGDGRLYMMGAFGVDTIGYPAGDEVEYMSLTLENMDGRTFTQHYDRNVAGADAQENFFYGLAYNLDGGPLGDDEDEGISFAPLAPSTSYTAGPLFSPFISPIPFEEGLVPCDGFQQGNCGNVVSLLPGEEFPQFEITFTSFSSAPVPATDELRFSFMQDGFPNGGRIHGTLTGRDLDGDGRLYAAGDFLVNFLGFEPGDEILAASVTFENFDGGRNFTNVFEAPINDPANIFMAFSYDLDGGPMGDDPGEAFTVGPLAPSTTYVVGELLSPLVNPVPFEDTPLVTCGDSDAGVCATVVALVPGAEFPNVDVTFSEFSAAPVPMAADPARVSAPYSGSWYDTERSGEGIVMHLLPDGRVLVYWMTYDDEGKQRWFLGTGQVVGTTVTIDDLYVTDGANFGPAFDPGDVTIEVAGGLTIEFDGCNSGTLRYLVDGQEGSLNLTRLTAVSSLTCLP